MLELVLFSSTLCSVLLLLSLVLDSSLSTCSVLSGWGSSALSDAVDSSVSLVEISLDASHGCSVLVVEGSP